MIGAIIGDVVGSRFERNNYKKMDFQLFSKEGKMTDDSLMTLAVGKAVMEYELQREHSLESLVIQYMREIGRKYPRAGYGKGFLNWLFSENPEPYNSYGNGSAMRVSPVIHLAKTKEEVTHFSKIATQVTHNHREGLKGAEAIAMAGFMAKNGASKEEIELEIIEHYYPLDFTITQIRDSYRFSSSCQETVPQAIRAFLDGSSLEETLRLAVSIGGDSDTIASMAGAIGEEFYGVPDWMKEKVKEYIPGDMRMILDLWEKKQVFKET